MERKYTKCLVILAVLTALLLAGLVLHTGGLQLSAAELEQLLLALAALLRAL